MQSTKVYALLLSLPFRQRHEGELPSHICTYKCSYRNTCTYFVVCLHKFEAYAVQLVLGNRKDESVTGSTTGATEVAGVTAGSLDGDIGRSGSGD